MIQPFLRAQRVHQERLIVVKKPVLKLRNIAHTKFDIVTKV